jgi:protein TonB
MADLAIKPEPSSDRASAPAVRLGSFRSPTHESRLKVLRSNLRDFLFERPIKIRGGRGTYFTDGTFGAGISENLNEFFKPTPRSDGRSRLLVNWNVGFGGLWQNLRDLIHPPKLPPLQTTSQPIDVPDIWSENVQFKRIEALMVAVHVLILALIAGPFLSRIYAPSSTKASNPAMNVTDLSAYIPKLPSSAKKAGGGGGANDVAPVSKGRAPKFSYTQIARPLVQTPSNPKFPMQPTVLGNPAIVPPNINASNWGDPLASILTGSNGQGSGTGLGNGNGGGLGPGQEYGVGGGYPNAGTGGYGDPVCVYCPKPDFTDEAVKAKYQGTVMLSAIVTLDGRATNIQVVKGLGLGLDEKAVEALRNSRLKPAVGPDGKPAAVKAYFEMEFHLY